MITKTQPSNEPLLRAERLHRVVKGKTILADVSLSLQRGDVVALVGPSGAGKTTCLRLLNRLDEPTSGTVYLNGHDYRTMAPRDVRQRVGMVLQRPYLFPETVADNVRYGPLQRGVMLSDDAVEELLCHVGLSGYSSRTVNKLSGGEAQRISLVRTVANNPDVLLLDEPTSALDDANERDAEALICALVSQHHLACVMITHDTDQAQRMAHRIMTLENGKLLHIRSVTSS